MRDLAEILKKGFDDPVVFLEMAGVCARTRICPPHLLNPWAAEYVRKAVFVKRLWFGENARRTYFFADRKALIERTQCSLIVPSLGRIVFLALYDWHEGVIKESLWPPEVLYKKKAPG